MAPMEPAPSRRPADESGAVAVITALILTVLLMFSAFVIDIGALRADRSLGQTVSDMAAAAAAQEYDPRIGGSVQDACQQAVAYASENLGVAFDPGNCTSFPAGLCDPTGPPIQVSFEAGDYTLTVTNPVPDGPGLMQNAAYGLEIDGTPCERVGVQLNRTRDFLLAGAGGSNLAGGETTVGAVGRASPGDEGEYASLIVLRRNGCQTLSNTGGANIRVFDLERIEDGDLVTYPGTVTVDTLPQGCGGMQKVIQARTATGALIEATGVLYAHSLTTDTANASSYPPAAVPNNLRGGPFPPYAPVPGPRITRAPIDDAVNCHPGGYPSGHTWSPDRFGQDIPACDGTSAPYIADLKSGIGGITSAATASAAGWAVYPASGQACDDGGVVTPAVMGGIDRLFINCTEVGASSFDPDGLELVGFSHIVFQDTMRVGSGEDLEIRGDPTTGTVVYFPTGGIDHRGGNLRLRDVFVYIDAPTGSARLTMTGSAEELAWQAPLDESGCAGVVPNAACFAPLALWSNGNAENSLQGNGGGGVIGTMFTPNALFKVRGSSSFSEDPCSDTVTWADLLAAGVSNILNFESSQFFAAELDTAGGGTVRLCPSPDTTFDIPLKGSFLIR